MSNLKKFVFGLALVAVLFGVSFTSVSAQTAAELNAQIQLLLSQIAALQGGAPATGGYTFSTDLTIGSTGADVTALQNILISSGNLVMPAGTAKGYFGNLTKTAVMAWQTAHGVNPTGYVGPMTRAALNSMGGTMTPPVTGGATCPAGFNCTPTTPVSTTCPAGFTCTPVGGGTPTVGTGLSGSTGVVEDYTLMSSITNQDVGEDEEDVEVIGLVVEADSNSDLELTAVRVVFNESTNTTSDFEDYASEVSVWLDGEELARIDGSEFTDENNWTKTIALDDGAIIKAGETGDLTVAVSAVSNLDSSDDDPDSWTADITSLRYVDGRGDSTSEDPGTATRTFNFKSFASASDVELKITEDDDAINDFHIIEIDRKSVV